MLQKEVFGWYDIDLAASITASAREAIREAAFKVRELTMSRIEDEVCKKIKARSDVGKRKYGVTMEEETLTRLEWLIHAQEEAMDLAVYTDGINGVEIHH